MTLDESNGKKEINDGGGRRGGRQMKRADLRKRHKPFEGKRVSVSYLFDREVKTATDVVTHVGWGTVWLKTKYEIAELGRAASIDIPIACIIAIAGLGDEDRKAQKGFGPFYFALSSSTVALLQPLQLRSVQSRISPIENF